MRKPLDGALTLENQNAGLAHGMRDMLVADVRDEMSPTANRATCSRAGKAIVHVDFAIEDAEEFGAVIHVPAIGLVRPMQACRRPSISTRSRAPRAARPGSCAHL